MFGSLRSRLVAAFSLIILLCLVLAGSAFAYLMRDYQTQITLNQLTDLSFPLASQVDVLERTGAGSTEIAQYLDDQAQLLRVRLLLVDSGGKVSVDTGGALVGKTVPVPASVRGSDVRPADPRSDDSRPGQVRRPVSQPYQDDEGHELYLIIADQRPNRPGLERFTGGTPDYHVAVAVSKASLADGWWKVAPMLSLAAALSLLVSAVVAVLLARSIAGPIAEMTRASERMARGDYDQHIPTGRQDEVGKLAESFNRMAHEVARSHRTLKDFLVNVSHDLRTPLTSIQGFAQAMMDGTIQTPEEYETAGRIIDDESARMRRIVEDLLDLSRLESGQSTMARDAVDLAGLLDANASRARRWADEKGVTLETRIEPLPAVRGDGHRLEQVFANLLDNAVKYTPPGHQITVHASAKSNGNPRAASRIEVKVHNTGSYIAPDDLSRVFERFYQADPSRVAIGSGLGLAIVREIVQAHGGTVSATSDPDAGTTFVVSLPASPTAG